MFKKFKNQKYASIAYYAFLVIACSILLIFSLTNLSDLWSYVRGIFSAVLAFIYGFAIAYICNPIFKWLHAHVFAFTERKKPRPKLRRILSVICAYLFVFGIIVGMVFALIPSIRENIQMLVNNIETYLDQFQTSVTNILKDLPFDIPIFEADNIMELLGKIFSGIIDEEGNIKFAALLNPIIDIGANIVSHIVAFVVGIVLSFYFLMSKHVMIAKTKKFFCAMFPKKIYNKLAEFATYTDRTFGRYLMGALLDSILVGVIVIIVLSILNFKFAALIGLIIGLTNLIPFFGPWIGGIPSALIILIADGPWQMLIFALFILVLQQVDGNIINPHIVGATTGLTPIGVIAAVTVCSHLFGFIGMLIGVPFCAVITYLFSKFLNSRLKKKNLPSDTKLYRNKDVFSNQDFINASIEVEAKNLIEKNEEESAESAASYEHSKAVLEVHDRIIFEKSNPEQFPIIEIEESDDEDEDDYLEDI